MKPEEYPRETFCKHLSMVTGVLVYFERKEKCKSECEKGVEPEALQPTYSRLTFTSGRITTDRRCLPFLVGYNSTDCVSGIAGASLNVYSICTVSCLMSNTRSLLMFSDNKSHAANLNKSWRTHILFDTGGSLRSQLLRHPGFNLPCNCAADHDRPCPQRLNVTSLLCFLKCAWW